VAVLGVATLLMAGVIALVQTDIKRIIAYSTMSQIGYMFAAVGAGAYAAGMYHLLTHAFFKALLFLGAGIVIHALADEQDVRKMGGLAKAMPRTTMLMWVGTIALIGFWPLSKDEILASGLHRGGGLGWMVFLGGLVGAGLTGIYATRLMRLVFYGEQSEYVKQHLHSGHGEAPWTMFWPVVVLAAGAFLSGFLAVGFGVTNVFAEFLGATAPNIDPTAGEDFVTTAIAWSLGGAGGYYVWRLYDSPTRVVAVRQRFETMAIIAEAKFGWDELYYNIGYRPAVWTAITLDRVFERWVIGGSIWVARTVVETIARATAAAQSGIVRQYATVLAGGAAIVAVYFLGKASL
jgi:NADH-quinone oxidoreductase subunit L